MKKHLKTIFGLFTAISLLAAVTGCSPATDDPTADTKTPSAEEKAAVYSGDEITFTATKASKNSTDVKLIIKYERSAAGADEKITLENVDLAVTYNGEAVSMPETIDFALDAYSSFRDDYDYSEEKEVNRKDYKVNFNLGKAIKAGDVVKVTLNSATVTGAGAGKVDLGAIVISLIDTAEAAGYYTELCPNDKEYQTLITKKDGKALNVPENQENKTDNTDNQTTKPDDTQKPADTTNPTKPTDTTTPTDDTPVVYSGKELTFTAIKDSTNAEDVNFILKYDRSAVGADEKITMENVILTVTYNDEVISMPETIDFALDAYSSFRDDYDYSEETEENRKEYKVKLALGKEIKNGDVVKVTLKSANISGAGVGKVDLGAIVISLIDTAEAAGYYTPLCGESENYQPLIAL